ncbi:unnamed protein product [Aureobasidium vineae]|uniref:Uncharacterized protein n=1 Tax=Aureobasidium vineae TaxID=2773715 RepID=A0A9N8J9T3_9PEZI|nr:unnamed protein product [Aureobasidium vineae]
MHENMDIETGRYLQRRDSRVPKSRLPNQVTICYLTFPSTRAVTHTMIDYGCGDSGYAAGTLGKSMVVQPEPLQLTGSRTRRFAKCMRALSLEPFVHPSQLRNSLGPSSAQEPPQVVFSPHQFQARRAPE